MTNSSVCFPTMRRQWLEAADAADLLVVGGGIVGAGIARDAAMRGWRVALVEQYDFASGTSSRSSRLLHGGLRYLAQGRLGLVREASVEKCTLGRIAPHLTDPMSFVFASYRGNGWPLWKLSLGVKLYDLLCGGANFGRSQRLDIAAIQSRVPGVAATDLRGGVRYFDAFTNDARMVLDSLRSAVNAGAIVLNYCPLIDATSMQDDIWRCQLHDRVIDQKVEVHVRAVVNATGPWAEKLPVSRVRLRTTKGVHLVLDRSRLNLSEAFVGTDRRRILFAIPWGERIILGTTDSDYAGRPEDVQCDASDVDCVLKVFNRCFPGADLKPVDVISMWAGVRPLIATSGRGPSAVSRNHLIRSPQPGWWDIAGGKLTTHRLMAEQATDAIEVYLGLPHQPCRTAIEPLLPSCEATKYSGIVPVPVTQGAVEHFCAVEWAEHLADVMLRRSGWHNYFLERQTISERVAGWMGSFFGWSDERTAWEREQYEALVNAEKQAL